MATIFCPAEQYLFVGTLEVCPTNLRDTLREQQTSRDDDWSEAAHQIHLMNGPVQAINFHHTHFIHRNPIMSL